MHDITNSAATQEVEEKNTNSATESMENEQQHRTSGGSATRKGRKRKASCADQPLAVLSNQAREDFLKELSAKTWKELEAGRRFTKRMKAVLIDSFTAVVGCDVGSTENYYRIMSCRKIEYTRKPLNAENNEAGFEKALKWMTEVCVTNGIRQIILGIEPTSHYWYHLYRWMVQHGVTVVMVNPYAVKVTKEVSDNSQSKNDRKDPRVIARLVVDGDYSVPYLPEGVYEELRHLQRQRDEHIEDKIVWLNRLLADLFDYFPGYSEIFSSADQISSLIILEATGGAAGIARMGEEGLKQLLAQAGIKGRPYSKLKELVELADQIQKKLTLTDASGRAIRSHARHILMAIEEVEATEVQMEQYVSSVPNADTLLAIKGIGGVILGGIISELGDVSRFDSPEEIQKLAGLAIATNSSGKNDGRAKISKRGRKRLRYWFTQAAMSVCRYCAEFKQLLNYYTTRDENPLKKMQAYVVIAKKLIRIVFKILKTGVAFDASKMLKDIVRPSAA